MELTTLEEKLIDRLREDSGYANDIFIEFGDLKLSEVIQMCDRCMGLTRHECYQWNGEEEETCCCSECRKES